ncbi:LuxR C-terminal-related transcriptional regulator, partial [Chloroflexota bacterium]
AAVCLILLSRTDLHQGAYEEAERRINEAFALLQQIGIAWVNSWALYQRAEVVFALGRERNLSSHVFRILKTGDEMGLNSYLGSLSVCEGLMIFAKMLCDQNRFVRSLELHSLAITHTPAPESIPLSEASFEPCDQQIREALSPDEYSAAITRGQNLDLAEVVHNLLAEITPVQDTCVSPQNQSSVDALSPRELEVLSLIAEGLSNQEIAQKLFITAGTVKKHANNIFGKLGVNNRTHAVARARALNLLPDLPRE